MLGNNVSHTFSITKQKNLLCPLPFLNSNNLYDAGLSSGGINVEHWVNGNIKIWEKNHILVPKM